MCFGQFPGGVHTYTSGPCRSRLLLLLGWWKYDYSRRGFRVKGLGLYGEGKEEWKLQYGSGFRVLFLAQAFPYIETSRTHCSTHSLSFHGIFPHRGFPTFRALLSLLRSFIFRGLETQRSLMGNYLSKGILCRLCL